MHRLPAALLGFAAGCVVLQWQPALPGAGAWVGMGVLAALAVGLAAGLPARPAAIATPVAVAIACGLFGFAYAAWRAEWRLADALPTAWEGRDLTLVGVVDDLPATSAQGTRFAFRAERVLTPGAAVPSRLSLAWYAAQRNAGADDVPPLRAGERWRLSVRLKRPHGNVNPHGFDLEAWLLQSGLRATGYVRSPGDNLRIDAFAARPLDFVQSARDSVRDRIRRSLGDAPYAGVIVALAIGEQRAISESQWLVFNRTGITHLISISGLHVTVFAALAAALAHGLARRSARLTTRIPARRIAALAGGLAAFGYMLLAGAQIPAQRTFVMLAVAAAGLWLARPGTARIVWLWALAIVLVFDPWAGLTPGFWLSYGAVGLLLYAGTARLGSSPASRVDAWRRALRGACHAQVVVTLGLVPLTLAVFQQISVVAPLANAFAIPAVTFAVVPVALTAIVLPFDWPWQLAHALFAGLMVPLDWCAHLPGAIWQQHAPEAWTIVAALAGVVWMIAPRGVPWRALGSLWLVPLFVVRPSPPPYGAFDLTVLDVGQGLAVVVRTRDHVLLYDTGPRFTADADAGSRIVAPFLRAAGMRSLSMLVVSHLDSDHSGGTRSLLQTVPVARLLSSVNYDAALWQGAALDLVRCRAGQHWAWDGVEFAVLHPPPQAYAAARPRTNDMSCVLRVGSPYGSALLTGDIEARSEAGLLASPVMLATDVLVVPHHGSRTSSTPAFIAAIAPRLAIFTPGYRNRFGHPRGDVVERYRAAGAALARTDLQGAITMRFDGNQPLRWLAARDTQRHYWYDPAMDAGEMAGDVPAPARDPDDGEPAPRTGVASTSPPGDTRAASARSVR